MENELRTTSLDLASYALSRGVTLTKSEMIDGSTCAWCFQKTPEAIAIFKTFFNKTGDGATIEAFQVARRHLLAQFRRLASENGGGAR